MENITKEKITKISNDVSGNLDNDYQVNVSLVRRKIVVEDYVMLFQKAVLMMLDGGVSKNGLKIFVYMLGKLQYSNHIGVDQQTIADDNKMSLVYVKKTIAELKKVNVILPYKDIQDRRRSVYVINPIVAWKGKVVNRKKFVKTIDKSQLKLGI